MSVGRIGKHKHVRSFILDSDDPKSQYILEKAGKYFKQKRKK